MIPLEQMTDEQFEQHALSVLHRELGVYGLARFLRVYRAGTGDYTRDRHQWLEGLTVQELAQEFEGRQGLRSTQERNRDSLLSAFIQKTSSR